MYELLKGNADLTALPRPDKIEYHRVFDTALETGATHFVHGAAVEAYAGRMAISFALNRVFENTVGEELLIRWSDDCGRTWTRPEHITPPADCAHSHGVFLVSKGELYYFGPIFFGWGEPPVTHKGNKSISFVDLQMEGWRLEAGRWIAMGVVADGFWPVGAPTRMEDGNWLIAGTNERWLAACAISRGDDFTRWDVVRIDTDGEVLTEAGAWVMGNKVLAVMRNESLQTDGKYHAAVSLSDDYGKTFGRCEISNLPIATTKPFCGVLADGRPYLLFNQSIPGMPRDRGRLLLGIGKAGEFGIRDVYLVDEGAEAADGRRLALSYPYAKQIDDRLFIAYSYESAPGGTGCNHNDAMLAIIDVSSLRA